MCHTRAVISLKEIEQVRCPLCGALVQVDVREGPVFLGLVSCGPVGAGYSLWSPKRCAEAGL
jgi:hypothetical protein